MLICEAIYWVETKGKTLEEIDAIFDGTKHSDVPDSEAVRRGERTVDVAAIETGLVAEISESKADSGLMKRVRTTTQG